MRKLLWFLLGLCVLCFTQATSTAYACHKDAWLVSTGDGDMIIETHEEIVWRMMIGVSNFWGSVDWTDIVVKDRLAAELEIVSIEPGYKGTVEYYYKGKDGRCATTIEWNIGTLAPGEEARLYLIVHTKLNPSKNQQQEYTESGCYELNSGAVMWYRDHGIKYSEEMASLWVYVNPRMD